MEMHKQYENININKYIHALTKISLELMVSETFWRRNTLDGKFSFKK